DGIRDKLVTGVQTCALPIYLGDDPLVRRVEVMRELDTAHERIVAEIEMLSTEQIHADEDWVVTVVAGNTYGHYAEHFDEVFAAEIGRASCRERVETAARSGV